jgi:hypothetical protein
VEVHAGRLGNTIHGAPVVTPAALADPTVELVAELLAISEAEAARLLDDLEAAGCIESAEGPLQ